MSRKISIITVNLNNCAGLEKTIASIKKQTTKDFEYLVIDGGSVDGSVELANRNTDLISVFISEKDSGIYDAMNKGIKLAGGEYLQFLNSGDELYSEETISKVLPVLGNEDIVYGNMKINDKGIITDGFMPDKIDLRQMVVDTLWHPVSFIRKELFTRVGLYDTSFRIAADYDFFFKAIINTRCSTKHIKQFVAIFDLTGMSSDIKNVELIRTEKARVQNQFLSQEIIDAYKHPQKEDVPLLQKLMRWFR